MFDSSDTLALDWKGLYQEHGPRLRRIAERRVGPGQAEDVVQDTFMRAFRNRTSLDPSRPIGAWLSSITLYSSTDALRRQSVRPELAAGDEPEPATGWTVEDEFENAVRRMGIEKAFDSLNHRQRRVLQRLEVDGWTQEEVATHEQISTEAVKSLAARARRTFREAYSAFAENMGVFGGAVAGPALLRLRARIQRLQGFAVEHVGAFSVAAATVTVVVIATVPSSRPAPTMAEENRFGPDAGSKPEHLSASAGAGVPEQPRTAPAPASEITPAAAVPALSQTSTSASSATEASVTIANDESTTSAVVEVESEGSDGSDTATSWLAIECEAGYTGAAMCGVTPTLPE